MIMNIENLLTFFLIFEFHKQNTQDEVEILVVYLPGYLPGVATPVLLKYLCSHRVSRTSVLEETHPRLFQSLQTILESVRGTCIHCVMIQTVPSVD